MNIKKRNGKLESLKFDKIVKRIEKQTYGLDLNFVDHNQVALTVFNGLYDGASVQEIDELIAEASASLSTIHPDYSILASRIVVSSLHKETNKSFYLTVKKLYEDKIVNKDFYECVSRNKDILDSSIIHDRDFSYDYFGIKTLMASYLLRDANKFLLERPQYMIMRVCVSLWKDDIEEVLRSYDWMSNKLFTHATPTLFNAGTLREQLSSCFLLTVDDSIDDIYKVLSDCAKISQSAGGIGLSISNVRAKNSIIKGTNGISDGIVPMLRVYNETACYVNQSGKRKGSFAIFIEPWHADIFEFLDLKKTHGKEEMRARDLFYALWVPDLFMEQVQKDDYWYLMCPSESIGLVDAYGEEFNTLYNYYVEKGIYKKKIKARELYTKIIDSQIETGTPYISFKDAVNNKSNQKNLGTIKSSNLCNEIVEYTSKDEQAVCNLSSIALPKFVTNDKFDFDLLHKVAYQNVKNLNQIIDINFYPTKETRNSNLRHRPVAVGVQGLADVFALLKLPFDSDKAKILNKQIFETIYHGALQASCDIAKKDGAYSSYKGSPISKGIFQFDMWNSVVVNNTKDGMQISSSSNVELSGLWDWDALREDIMKYGVRNSLTTASMPTASTSQILGNNECFEPYTSNIYSRRTLHGTFTLVNKHLIKDLIEIGLWNDSMRKLIIANEGSIQNIDSIPQNLKSLYKTVWEIKQKDLIDMSADRGAFIDQTQSLNLFFENINHAKISSSLLYGWLKGLKTGSYYIRQQTKASANKSLGIDLSSIKEQVFDSNDSISCSLDNPEACIACSA
jgi:ribonucleoside-diphosphate reductase alpha chain